MPYRKEKIEEQIRRLISELIIKDIKDPRVGFVSITGVKLSSDKKYAKVGISILGSPRDIRKSFEGLKSATGYIQHRVGKGLAMRNTPRLGFFLDSSVADGVSMVDLLENLDGVEKSVENSDLTDDTRGV